MNATKRLQSWSLKCLAGFWRSRDGLGTLEIVLIAAVIIAIAILFKDWIIEFLQNLFGQVEDKSKDVFE